MPLVDPDALATAAPDSPKGFVDPEEQAQQKPPSKDPNTFQAKFEKEQADARAKPNYHPERESEGVRQVAKALLGIENPLYVLKNESVMQNLYNAYQKGVFNKPLGEMISNAEDKVKDFSMKQLWEAAKEN